MSSAIYILRLRSGQLYVGATTDLERRWQEHVRGEACRTSKLDPPVSIVYSEEHSTFADARRREAQIKRWSRAKREALVAGDTDALKRLAKSHDHQG
jgi:putative endonuclease